MYKETGDDPDEKVYRQSGFDRRYYPPQLKKKYVLFHYITNQMVGHESPFSLQESDSTRFVAPPTEPCGVYVRRVLKTQAAIVFKLSTRLVHVHFCDLKELVLDFRTQLLTLISPNGDKSVMPAAGAAEEDHPEFKKYVKYIQSLLTQFAS